ncbi:hypothetical protein BTJ40_14600 [Microbulbifer sp. A4B17]|nr:hypothetical protein BTJ40_14600 [Microbulbifer sp. A4B17]
MPLLLHITSEALAHTISENHYKIDVWADNWFSAYIDGTPLLEDSTPITTERSFNKETKSFSAEPPFVLSFKIKDYKENNTGLEYIGTHRQQMGDGGFITQITNQDTGKVITTSDSAMRCIVIHKAPLSSSCTQESNPIAGQGGCQFNTSQEPNDWKTASFDDSSWQQATEYSAHQVRPKDGYEQVEWNSKAKLIWTSDLEKDNTILCRMVVGITPATVPVTQENTQNELQSQFSHFPNVKTRVDSNYLYIESNGMPNHDMMEGITSWQQQVPLPQGYTGNNAWRVPLKPVLAKEPILTKTHFFKGAIAIAVNGVPIFNAMNNRGEFAADIGELDKWGGHSGRGDDYHYHLAPIHLEPIVGKGNPIAYALDGFPLLGKTDKPLDQYLGRFNEEGSYQYHAVDYPPYFIAGLRGEVNTDSPANAPEDQIIPQPSALPVRNGEYGPLQGAIITTFTKISDNSYKLTYTLNGSENQVNYSWDKSGTYQFVFIDKDDKKTVETFQKNKSPTPEDGKQRPSLRDLGKKSAGSQHKPRKYCGDGLCDKTENRQQCPADC